MNHNLAISQEYLDKQAIVSQNHLANILETVRNGKLSSLIKSFSLDDLEDLLNEGGWGPA